MDRRHRARVTGIDRAQEGKSFGAPDLADEEAVRPHAERGFEQLTGSSHLRFPDHLAMRAGERQFACGGNSSRVSSSVMMRSCGSMLFRQALRNVVLPDRRAAADQDRDALADGRVDEIVDALAPQKLSIRPRSVSLRPPTATAHFLERAVVAVVLEREVADDLLADRDRAAIGRRRRQNDLDALAGWKCGAQDRIGAADELVRRRRRRARRCSRSRRS